MGTLENIAGRKSRTVTTTDTTKENFPMLTSRIHAERVAAHEAARAQVALEVEALDREITRATIARNVKREHGMDHADAALEATRASLSEALAADWHATMDPLFASWIDEPGRRLAGKIADAARGMQARSREELGADLWSGTFTVSLCNAMASTRPIVAALDLANTRIFVEGASACWTSIQSTQQFADALGRLELGIADRARRPDAPTDEDRARFETLRRVATHADLTRLLSGHDATVRRTRHEAAKAEDARPGANNGGTVRFFGGA